MKQQGHPQRPLQRDSLPLESLVTDFLAHTQEEDRRLAAYLEDLDPAGRRELGGILGRFDMQGRGYLEPQQRLFARRVLSRLQRPDKDMLRLLNQVLDYLDLNHNALLEEDEADLCVQICELFARAVSDNETLTELELKMLYAVLRHLDSNDNRRLDAHERQQLHDALGDPEVFWAKQKATNPLLRDLMGVS